MVLEASDNLKQLWEGLRHFLSIVFSTLKTILEASGNLKQLWEGLRHL